MNKTNGSMVERSMVFDAHMARDAQNFIEPITALSGKGSLPSLNGSSNDRSLI